MPFDSILSDDEISRLSDERLGEAIAELAAHIHAATYRFLLLVAEVDRRELWAKHGAMSCSHWLSWACGIGRNAAREKVRVARALESLPLLSEHLARGELSFSKVRALTRIATPGNEADMLNLGLHGTANHVETLVRYYRRAVRAEETEQANERHARRRLVWHYEDDGTIVFRAYLPPELGTKVIKALETAIEAHEAEQPAVAEDAGPEETSPQDVTRVTPPPRQPWAVRRADAFVWMCERLLEGGDSPPTLASNAPEVVVHVDADVLKNGGPGRCEVEDGPALTAETARRLSCDSGVVQMVDGADGEPLSVGRRTRSIPPAVRRALASRDKGCRFPGCTSTHRLHGHHVRHWADGGETSLSNLCLLCSFHHRLVHEGGFDVEALDDRAFRFVRPDGRAIRPPVKPDVGSARVLLAENRRRGLAIGPETCMARWDGTRPDYDHALIVMLQPCARR